MQTLESFAELEVEELQKEQLLRSFSENERHNSARILRNDKELISFCCNDYFGLSQHPVVKQAAIEATEKYGIGSGASRYISGNHPYYDLLEKKLAAYKGTEAALVFGSGYLANIGTIPALVGKGDLIIADKLAHACLLDGAKLSGAKLLRFKHNDIEACRRILETHRQDYQKCLIITETIFSMDGDRAPVSELATIAKQHDSWLLTDDAHGIGVLEPHPEVPLQIGTLSKGLGSYGGYLCASQKVIDYVRNKARSAIFSTALPPATVAAAIASLEILEKEPERAENALENAQYFTKLMGLEQAQSTIVPYIVGDERTALDLAKKLEEAGFLVSAIRPPTVPKGTARLRFTFSSEHSRDSIENLSRILQTRTR